ncbi:MAG: aminotransferase class V-fold PLP-dependent enzyme [Deltaproteobacteria bacterium]|nr:aminotransferase class V-fold PLP-dependent enzyme [Deltaproteobacteria bacterium]
MIYLDNAATSYPKPECVYAGVEDVLRKVGGNPGRSGHRLSVEAARVIFRARESVAKLLNVRDSSRVVFTKNATEAINVALKGLLGPGDHVVTTAFEHNSVVRTLRRLEAGGVKVTKVRGRRPDLIEPRDIEKALTGKTRLVAIVHASNVFGTIEPVSEIGALLRKKGIPFMVDGAQSVGSIPVDVEGMDIGILAATGHKSLFGPQGTGFLYIKEGLEPPALIDGGTGEGDDVLEIPDRLETGTMNTPGVGGLAVGVEFILKEGVSKIREHEKALIKELMDGLGGIRGAVILGPPEPESRVSLVSFNMEGKSAVDVGVRLDREFSIMVRCGTHCAPDAHVSAGTYPHGAIRVSPGYFNTHEDISAFLKAVSKIAKG